LRGEQEEAASSSSTLGLHLIFPSFDGHLYLVDGSTGCTNKVDVGEHVHGQVLVDDILGRGKLDLLVGTRNGNVYCFSTEVDVSTAHHPLRRWSTPTPQVLNTFTVQEGYQGVHFTQAARDSLGVVHGATYEVSFYTGSTLLATTHHSAPGVYSFTLSSGPLPRYTLLRIELTNEHHQVFEEEIVVGLNVHFYRSIKVGAEGEQRRRREREKAEKKRKREGRAIEPILTDVSFLRLLLSCFPSLCCST
jgi:hypothetical protein